MDMKQHPEAKATPTNEGEQRTARAPARPVESMPSHGEAPLPQSLLTVGYLQKVYVLGY